MIGWVTLFYLKFGGLPATQKKHPLGVKKNQLYSRSALRTYAVHSRVDTTQKGGEKGVSQGVAFLEKPPVWAGEKQKGWVHLWSFMMSVVITLASLQARRCAVAINTEKLIWVNSCKIRATIGTSGPRPHAHTHAVRGCVHFPISKLPKCP